MLPETVVADKEDNLPATSLTLSKCFQIGRALVNYLRQHWKTILSWSRIILRRARRSSPTPKAIKGLYPYYERDGEFFSRLDRHQEIQDCLNLLQDTSTALVELH